MTTGAQPAKLAGTGVVIRKDGTKVEFKFESPVEPGMEKAAESIAAQFNKLKEEPDDGGNA